MTHGKTEENAESLVYAVPGHTPMMSKNIPDAPEGIGLASIKPEGKAYSFDNPDVDPWDGHVAEFDKFFDEEYGRKTIPKAIKRYLKKAMRKSWDKALQTNAERISAYGNNNYDT